MYRPSIVLVFPCALVSARRPVIACHDYSTKIEKQRLPSFRFSVRPSVRRLHLSPHILTSRSRSPHPHPCLFTGARTSYPARRCPIFYLNICVSGPFFPFPVPVPVRPPRGTVWYCLVLSPRRKTPRHLRRPRAMSRTFVRAPRARGFTLVYYAACPGPHCGGRRYRI